MNSKVSRGKTGPPRNVTGTGKTNFVPLWKSTTLLGSSNIFQNPTTANSGIGTSTPGVPLDVKVNTTGVHDPIARFGSSGTTDGNATNTYNGTGFTETFAVGVANQFVPGAGAGDGGLRVAPGKNVLLGDANAARMMLSGTGNVGLGTSAPQGKLSVASTNPGSGFNGILSWNSAYSIFGPNVGSSTGAALGISYSTTDNAANILSLKPSVAWEPLRLASGGLIIDAANGNEAMRVTSSGDVGIGTSNPGNRLEVDGGNISSAGNGVKVLLGNVGCASPTWGIQAANIAANCGNFALGIDASSPGGTFINRRLGGAIHFKEANNPAGDQMVILTGGNVGIGTNSPSARLEVDGPATDSGQLAMDVEGGVSSAVGGIAGDGIHGSGGNGNGGSGVGGNGVSGFGGTGVGNGGSRSKLNLVGVPKWHRGHWNGRGQF